MNRNAVNFWVDACSLVVFLVVVSTGALLRGFPVEMAERTILGVARHDWADLHWVCSLLLLVLVAVHFVLHWKWVKANTEKRAKLGSKALAVVLLVAFLAFCVFVPVSLTRGLRDQGASAFTGRTITPR